MPFDLKALAKQQGVRRRRIVLRPIEPPRSMEAQYRRVLVRMVNEISAYTRQEIVPAVTREREMMQDAAGDRLEGLFSGLRRLVTRLYGAADDMTRRIFEAEAQRHTEAFAGVIRSAIGIDMSAVLRSSPGLEDRISLAALRNAELIKGLAEDTEKRVAEAITRNLTQGGTARDLSQELQEQFAIEQRRASLIARNEVANINSQLNELRQKEAGVEMYVWRTSQDERVRPDHAALEGTQHKWSDPGPDNGNHPGEAINCLPGEASVRTQANIERLFRRRHAGEATLIISDTGETLKATPNHPILTRAGWKPAKLVDVGDDLVEIGFGGSGFLELDVDQRQPRIGDLFNLVALVDAKEVCRGLRGDFHGDAVIDEDVEIVSLERALRFNDVPACPERLAKRILESALVGFVAFAGLRFQSELVEASTLSTDSIMRLAGEMESFLWAQALHPDPVGLAAVTDWHAAANEVIGDRLAIAAIGICQSENAFTGLVPGDHLVAIELLRVLRWAVASLHNEAATDAESIAKGGSVVANLAGGIPEHVACFNIAYRTVKRVVGDRVHEVFNLETANSWFIAQNRVVHNCRCTAQAVIELD